MGAYHSANSTLMYHLVGLSIAWVPLANLCVYMAIVKHKIWGYYIHAILGWIIIIATLIGTLMYIIPRGLPHNCLISTEPVVWCDPYQFPLAVLGVVHTFWIAIQVFSGIWARAHQQDPKSSSIWILRSKAFHQWSGYIIILLGKANTYIHWRNVYEIWIPLVAFQILCILIYVKAKYYYRSLEETILESQTSQTPIKLPEVRCLQDLQKGKTQYLIFADYVYETWPLMTLHPAGYQVINATKGRQIDRFVYGMYAAELVSQVPAYSHPWNSFELIGPPVAKISISPAYLNMDQLNDARIASIQTVSQKGMIYIIGMESLNAKPFKFKGYSNLDQPGQYFSLTFKKITRLYTVVNSLKKSNRILMEEISLQMRGRNQPIIVSNQSNIDRSKQSSQSEGYSSKKSTQIRLKSKDIPASSISNEHINGKFEEIGVQKQKLYDDELIPLMIKKYDSGKLTPLLIKDDNKQFPQNLRMSCPRGQGLKIQMCKPGNIVLVAGGTGFYPFMDTIDILFKQKVVQQNRYSEFIRDKILDLNPVVREPVLKDYSFILFLAIVNEQDVHPMPLFQINSLCSNKENFRVILRIKQGKEQLANNYRNFQFTNEYFDDLVLAQAQKQSTSKTYICGSPAMNTNVATKLIQNGIQQKKFELV